MFDLAEFTEKQLREALKQKRAERLAAVEIAPALPSYDSVKGEVDLNFEYGLELAFRPHTSRPVLAKDLPPFLFVNVVAPPSKHSWGYSSTDPVKSMFTNFMMKVIPHIGAKQGGISITSWNTHEIEFPSPIMTKMSQIEWYYTRIRNLANAIGATVDKPHTNSGGGHIQITPKGAEFTKSHIYTAYMELVDKPWLAWVFNDPDDRSTAMSVVPFLNDAAWEFVAGSPDSWWECLDTDNHTAVRENRHGGRRTIECRFFAAPRNFAEQKLHIQFVDAWLGAVLKKPLKINPKHPPKLRYNTIHDLEAIKLSEVVNKFNALLVELHLKPKDYAVFIQRNLKPRYRNGWARN